jgi:hypothetical protein
MVLGPFNAAVIVALAGDDPLTATAVAAAVDELHVTVALGIG